MNVFMFADDSLRYVFSGESSKKIMLPVQAGTVLCLSILCVLMSLNTLSYISDKFHILRVYNSFIS